MLVRARMYEMMYVLRLEKDIMSEMETRSEVPAASEAAPRHEYLAPRTANDRISLLMLMSSEGQIEDSATFRGGHWHDVYTWVVNQLRSTALALI